MEVYRKMGMVHVEKDPVVTWEDVQQSQREIRGHLRCLNHVFQTGKDRNMDRVWAAKESKSTTIPVLSLLLKDHKGPDKNGNPSSRPVCGASSSMNGELSEWLADILDAVAAAEPTDEVISGEELLAYVDEVNQRLQEEGLPEQGLCVGSLDVKALYPSLDINRCAQIIKERIQGTLMEFDGIDYTWASKYIALNMSRIEVIREDLQTLVPKKIAKTGSKPTVLTVDMDESKERWKFYKDPGKFNKEEKKRVMGKVCEILVKVTFGHHFYKWGDTVRRQASGGSIGLRGTGSVARTTMDRWISEYRRILTGAKVDIYLLKKYVDDVCIITRNLDWGARWNRDTQQVTYCG